MSDTDNNNEIDFKPFGEAIKEARINRGWTREYAAERAKISKEYLIKIENSGQHPSAKIIVAFLKLFGELSFDEFARTGYKENEYQITAEQAYVFEIIKSMSEEKFHILKTGLIAVESLIKE